MSKENSIVKIILGSIVGLAIVIAGFASMTNVKGSDSSSLIVDVR